MNPEKNENSSNPSFEEMEGYLSPETSQPADSETIQNLFDIVNKKSINGHDVLANKIRATTTRRLNFGEPDFGEFEVTSYRNGAIDKNNPARVAQIQHIEAANLDDFEDELLITEYFLDKNQDDADELRLTKCQHIFYEGEMYPRPFQHNLEDNLNSELLKQTLTIEESEKLEDELGLSEVSQSEAAHILTLLRESQYAEQR